LLMAGKSTTTTKSSAPATGSSTWRPDQALDLICVHLPALFVIWFLVVVAGMAPPGGRVWLALLQLLMPAHHVKIYFGRSSRWTSSHAVHQRRQPCALSASPTANWFTVPTRNLMREEDLETEQGLFLPIRIKKRGDWGELWESRSITVDLLLICFDMELAEIFQNPNLQNRTSVEMRHQVL
jgi:hypothetical protein